MGERGRGRGRRGRARKGEDKDAPRLRVVASRGKMDKQGQARGR